MFARDLLNTLRQRDLDNAAARLSAETGLAHHPSAEGEHVAGVYCRRVNLASGRFAMIDTAWDSSSFPGGRRWTATFASTYRA